MNDLPNLRHFSLPLCHSRPVWLSAPMKKGGYIYILTNRTIGFYTRGGTNDLKQRVWEHQSKQTKGFTKKYNVDKLVYYEAFNEIECAIWREKQTKAGSRKKKVALIAAKNPSWKDLSSEV